MLNKYRLLPNVLAIFAAAAVWGAPANGIIVKYRSNATAQLGVNSAAGLQRVDIGLAPQISQVASADFQLALNHLRSRPDVEYAEPNYLGQFADMPTAQPLPNDPAVPSQWWLNAVNAQLAWPISTGHDVLVAVIDTGVDLTHPDLVANLRPDGFNFGDNNAVPQDLNGHGTGVAGLIAASCHNAIAGCGLAYAAKILPIKINPANTTSFDSLALANAIDYAVQKRAKVINLSLTVSEQTLTVEAAIRRALAANITVVAAAGNTAGEVQFPANLAGVIGVAALDQNGALATFSNRGVGIAIAAPGVAMVSTLVGGGVGVIGAGTSFSAPLVSAAIGQLLSVFPTAEPNNVAALLAKTSKPIVASPFGVLDDAALLQILMPDLQPTVRKVIASGDVVLTVNFLLPEAGANLDIYVSAVTPIGEFGLLADGSWYDVAGSAPRSIVAGYTSQRALRGVLFGDQGVFPSIPSRGLPAGDYRWRISMRDSGTHQLLGTTIESPFTISVP